MNTFGNPLVHTLIRIALKEAQKASAKGEVPVAALVLKNNHIISKTHNMVQTKNDPTQHAEILAIKKALKILHVSRLEGCHMFTTLEPCAMCAGAIVLARIDKLYILAKDEKTGACGSVISVIPHHKLNHRPLIEWCDNYPEYTLMLKQFFKELRIKGSRL